MKTFKLFGIIALIAIIGFTMACGGGTTPHVCNPGAAATCTTPQTCTDSSCGKVITPALGHDWDKWTNISLEPTCTVAGKGDHKCKRCNLEEKDQPIPTIPHTWGAWPAAPSLPISVTAEAHERTCSVCPATETRSQITSYLVNQAGGASAADPITLTVTGSIETSGLALNTLTWWQLLNAIGISGKFITLDLTATTRTTDTFNANITDDFNTGDTNANIRTAKARIVTIILPNTRRTDLGGIGAELPAQRYFTNLREIRCSGSATILMGNALRGCANLTTLYLPSLAQSGTLSIIQANALADTNLTTITIGNIPDARFNATGHNGTDSIGLFRTYYTGIADGSRARTYTWNGTAWTSTN